ncbi:MAG: 50S ribosomal protein L23 [Candidatus Altimarinota bacterium]
MNANQIILKPLVSEKGTQLESQKTYSFLVARKATKIDVKNAIKTIFGADVAQVKIIITPSKSKQIRKGSAVKRAELKKAYVTLKNRAKLDLTKFSKDAKETKVKVAATKKAEPKETKAKKTAVKKTVKA